MAMRSSCLRLKLEQQNSLVMYRQTQPEAKGRVVHLNTLPFSIKLIFMY